MACPGLELFDSHVALDWRILVGGAQLHAALTPPGCLEVDILEQKQRSEHHDDDDDGRNGHDSGVHEKLSLLEAPGIVRRAGCAGSGAAGGNREIAGIVKIVKEEVEPSAAPTRAKIV